MSSKRIDMDALKDFAAELLPPGEPSDDAECISAATQAAAERVAQAIAGSRPD